MANTFLLTFYKTRCKQSLCVPYISRYVQLHFNNSCQFWWERTILSKTAGFQVWKNSHSDKRELLELSHLRVKMHH